MTTTDTAVIVVTYGSPQLLADNLDAAVLAGVPAELVVVDNFCTAEDRAATAAIARERGWHFLPMDTNIGFGAGMNLGVAFARDLGCTVFVLLNPDARADAAALGALRQACLADPGALVGPRILRGDGTQWSAGNYLDTRSGRMVNAGVARAAADRVGVLPDRYEFWLTGACLALHVRLWDRIGGFDDRYFLYWEDLELSHRAVTAGGRLVIRPDIEVVHAVGATQNPADSGRRGSAKSEIYYYYNARNRLLFAASNLPTGQAIRWMLGTPRAGWQILLRGGRRQLLTDRSGLRATVRGSAAGLSLAAGLLARRSRRPKVRT